MKNRKKTKKKHIFKQYTKIRIWKNVKILLKIDFSLTINFFRMRFGRADGKSKTSKLRILNILFFFYNSHKNLLKNILICHSMYKDCYDKF